MAANRQWPSARIRCIRVSGMGIHARPCASAHPSRSVSDVCNLDILLQSALAFLMSASVPPSKACRRGHSSTLWSSFVKQAGHTLPLADDPETGGPGPTGGPNADGTEAGGSAAGGSASVGGVAFSSGLCFLGGGLDVDDEDEDDEVR